VALGRALLEAGRYREASTTLRRAAVLRRNDPTALYEVARVDFAQHEHQRARAQCRAIERAAPDSAIAHVCQARAFLAWNRSARAFEELETALGSAPNDYEALLALGDAHRLRAAVPESEAAYRRAIEAAPNRAEPHLGLGQLYAQAHRMDDALTALRRAHELAPNDPDVDYELGRLTRGPEAVTHLREAITNRPGWAIAEAALGDALLAAGQHEEAATIFRQAIGRDSHLAQARSGLGRALMAAGNLQEAESTLTRAIEQVPNDADSVLALADVMAQTDRIEEAYEQYRHAADLDARNPEPLVRAAQLAIRQERPVLAVGFLQRAISIDESYGPALALMGDVMRARNQGTQARQYYERALRGEGEIDRAAIQQALRSLH
jgi:superkiller protein 3